MRGDGADRVVDADPLDEQARRRRRSIPATKPITIAAHGATNAHAAVIATSAAIAPFSIIERSGFLITSHEVPTAPSDAGRGGEVRVERDVREEADAAEVDAQRRARVEAEPPEPEDQHAERHERHVVARDRVRLTVRPELADARPEEQRAGEPGERALVVHDRRAGEVLHPSGEEPAVRAPDPVRDEGVDEREDDAEGEVDPELRPLGHRAPDDGQRDGAEDDLEEIAGRAGNRGEPRERRRADGQQLVDGRDEARACRRCRCHRRRRRSRSRRGSRRRTRARRRGRSSPRCARRSSFGSARPRGRRSRPA